MTTTLGRRACDRCNVCFDVTSGNQGKLCPECARQENRRETPRKERTIEGEYRCAGFLFPHDHPALDDPAGYNDFAAKRWTAEELEWDLVMGSLPPGMIVHAQGQYPGVVVACADGGQEVRRITEVMG